MIRAFGWMTIGWAVGCGATPEEPSTLDDPSSVEALWGDEPVFAALRDDGTTVREVDVPRYLGTWFEIGTYPILFQRECTASTATYTEVDEGIGVRNWCALGSPDGEPFEIEGTARPVDESNARLEVSFFGAGGAPYWVIELDGRDRAEPYTWAIVGGPTRSNLWILSRTPEIPEPFLDDLLEVLDRRGYDLDAIVWTEHTDPPPEGAVP